MYLKKLFPIFFFVISISVSAQDVGIKTKVYGFIRNDFFYNSRKSEESTDGVFNFFPKPIELSFETDKNAVPQAELISVNTRLGLDIFGSELFGAKSSARIETDFAGTGTTFFILRLRLAYMKLNWSKTELTIGQDWHPLFGSVAPNVLSLNGGAPFQPFNRSPQIKFKYLASNNLSLIASALYETQFASQGPNGATSTYMKNAMIPELFLGAEVKSIHWTSGVGVDVKTIKPDVKKLTSFTAAAYSQFTDKNLQLKAKVTLGQNTTDLGMIGGYGVSKYATDSVTVLSYTNLNTLNSWFNVVYGSKIQLGLLVGYSQNLGAEKEFDYRKGLKLTAYGCGFYDSGQQLIDRLIRISPQISYNLQNLKFGLELDYSSAVFGNIQRDGRVSSPYNVDNKRVVATMSYLF
ncbi:MAG: hypothetical protein WCK78_02625 [Paludibacter sp.]